MILPLKFTSAIVILVVMYRVAFLFTNKREKEKCKHRLLSFKANELQTYWVLLLSTP